jgi:hypothetical protein
LVFGFGGDLVQFSFQVDIYFGTLSPGSFIQNECQLETKIEQGRHQSQKPNILKVKKAEFFFNRAPGMKQPLRSDEPDSNINLY